MFTISLRVHLHGGASVHHLGASISLHLEQRTADRQSNVLAKLGDFENKTRIHSLLSLLCLVPLSFEVPVPLINLEAFKPTYFSGFLEHVFRHLATIFDVDIHKLAKLIVRFAATA